MSGGFQHDIAGGQGNLIITSVQSPNFAHGSAGWQVKKDGSAEFNSITVRGTISGTSYVINAAGMFVYSGTAALGNLVSSLGITTAGTDAQGNAYLVGDTSYTHVGGTYFAASLQGGAVIYYASTAGAGGAYTQYGEVGFSFAGSTGHLVLSGTDATGVEMSSNMSVDGNATIVGTLSVNGSTSTATAGLTDGTITGSSSTAGLANGQITGTSGAASAGTAHTHGGGSYAVTNGQHSHANGSYAVTNGTHQHVL